jgi:hypothetical protein
MEQQTFPLLALSKDIRLMVYERLLRQVQHRHIRVPQLSGGYSEPLTMITRYIPMSILAACHVIHSEANPHEVDRSIRRLGDQS